jgi:DNA-binding response OmpR family regulator
VSKARAALLNYFSPWSKPEFKYKKMKKILIIEDDPAISRGLGESLKAENYEVICEDNGESGFKAAQSSNPELIILDLMLPGKNGLEICKELRQEGNNVLILMLTSKTEEMDKVLGLEMGADDYVTKPFSLRELIARIKALLRRRNEIHKDIEKYSFGNVDVDFKRMETCKKSKQVKMSLKEFEILKFFINHEGEVVSRDKLLDEVWGYENYPTTRTVDNFILMLRKKIEDNPSVPKHILTFHSAGYKFVK